MAAPAYRSHQTAAVNGATLTITKPTGTAENDFLIAHILHVTGAQAIDPTPPTGFTLLGARQANSSCTQWWFTKVAGASEPASYDWTGLPSNFQIGSITAISGADTANPIDVSQVTQDTNIGATQIALSVTTTGADRLLWASASLDASAATAFAQADMTERWDESLSSFSFLSQAGYTGAAATATTYNRTITIDVAQRIAGALIAVAPVSGTTVTFGLATETDAALGLTASKATTYGQAAESDTALGASFAKTITFGLASEADTAAAASFTSANTLQFGLATETDTAFAMTWAKATTWGQATETDSAPGWAPAKTTQLGLATETDTAFAASLAKTIPYGMAAETDSALALAASKSIVLGIATETDAPAAMSFSGPYTPALVAVATTRAATGTAVPRDVSTTAVTRDLNGTATTRESA